MRTAVIRAEIMWACKCVVSHYSYHSNNNISALFKVMFPDSAIASQFQLGCDKVAYTITYGLAPFFKHQICSDAADAPEFVACFDESINKISQRCQMDIALRFWDRGGNRVVTRYVTSVFLGHSTACDIKDGFTSALRNCNLNLHRMLQISMDGPNVNWSFLQKLKEDTLDTPNQPDLLDLGSCGLHVVNGAFQTGNRATNWRLNSVLSSLYYLFKDSPARRADYIRITETTLFAKKFCPVRWIENSAAVQRAIEIMEPMQKYVDQVKPTPTVQSFAAVRMALKNNLLRAQLEFFVSVASIVEPFLAKFQTDRPMVPFLHAALQEMIVTLMRRFINPEALTAANTASKLSRIDVSPQSPSCLLLRQIDIGFGAEKALRAAKVSDIQRLSFREDCRSFLSCMTSKILERSPIKYRLVRAASSLSPKMILHSRSLSASRFQILLEILVQSNVITATTADKGKNQYSSFCDDPEVRSALSQFCENTDDLCDLYGPLLRSADQYDGIWLIMRKVLVLSHGNAFVERGFSVNGDILVENLKEESLIAQRLVYDSVKAMGGPDKIETSASLFQYVRSARSCYRDALEAKKNSNVAGRRKQSERKRAAQELRQLEVKKRQVEVEAAKEVKNMEMRIHELRGVASQ